MDGEMLWRTVMETMRDGLLVVDPQGTILAANPAAAELTGYRLDELIGRPCTILNCTGCELGGEAFCALFRRGQVRARQCFISHKSRRTLPILKHATVLRDASGRVAGAVETLTDVSELTRREEELVALRASLGLEEGFYGLLGDSPAMRRVFDFLASAARSEAPVFIQGESGTGKELAARAIHQASARAGRPYVRVNCAALNENLLESELFGHVKGAFTGADRTRVGRFEAAHGGTLFLDEIGDLSPAIQVKLLRILESKEIERVGDHRPIPVDVRIVTATHRDLEDLVARGLFREDLYFRINVIPIHLPPLRARAEDIVFLARRHLLAVAGRCGKDLTGFSAATLELLMSHPWPGNVRELHNAVEYAAVLCPGGSVEPVHLPPRLQGVRPTTRPGRDDPERERLVQALRECRANQSEAARRLGISRTTLWKKIKRHGIALEREIG